jgi:hypothetical protein
MGWRGWATCVVAMVGLAGCSTPPPDPQVAAAAHGIFDAIRRGDDQSLQPRLAPELKTPQVQAQLAIVRRYIPAGEPRGSKVIAWNRTITSGEGEIALLKEDYDYGDHVAQVQTRLVRPPGGTAWLVQGFHVQTATARELTVNDFTLIGRAPMQYLFLALVIASPAAMIWSLVKVIRAPGLKRKWLWGILAFVGLFSLQMNWSTGGIAINWLTVQLLGAGVTSGLSRFSPWFLTVTLPILTGVWANPARARKPRSTAPVGTEPTA